jgi:ABC-type antimicrobial peptide transport system permease subunit
VLRAIVGQGLAIVAIGLVLGVAAAFGLTRFLADLLYGTQPLDVMTFVSMTLVLMVVAAIASYLPARRAASINPIESLRND